MAGFAQRQYNRLTIHNIFVILKSLIMILQIGINGS